MATSRQGKNVIYRKMGHSEMATDKGSHLPSKEKAKKIMAHGKVRGRKLTKKQKGLMGLIAGGKKPTRIKKV